MKTLAFNPYLPSYEYIPDGEPYVFGDRVYVYGSHDRFGSKEFCPNDYVCWSAPIDDLGMWRNEGIIYKVSADPLNSNRKQNGYAPDVQRGLDGRYYLFYALNRTTIISVAVCDTPAGQYQFYGHVHFPDGRVSGNAPGDIYNFDPGVLVDSDGKVYLYVGFSPAGLMGTLVKQRKRALDGAYCYELEQDMLTIKSGPVLVVPGAKKAKGTGFDGHPFFEASSMRKIDEKYYFIYSSCLSHELCYAVSDRPDRGFRYGGILVSNGDIGLSGATKPVNYTGNNHGSIVEIGGKWYVFYHRQTNRHQFSRQGCSEQIEILPDGNIEQVEMTSCGLNGGPLAGTGEYEARIACNLSGPRGACISIEMKQRRGHPYFTQSKPDRESDGDQYIANMRDRAWAGYKYFHFEDENKISVHVRGDARGKLNVAVERDGEPAASVNIEPSAVWVTYSTSFHVTPGIHPLYFTYSGKGALDMISFSIQ